MVFAILLAMSISTLEYGPFKTSGSVQIQFKWDTIFGQSQTAPAKVWRFDLRPQFYFYNMPVSLNLFLSTEEENIRQQLNQYQLEFEPEKLITQFPSVPSFLFAFPGISFGSAYPEFSEFTLTQTRVDGFAFSYAPKPLYFEIASGKVDRAVSGDPDSVSVSFKRSLRGYKLGFGRPEGDHIHFIYIHSWDDPASLIPPDIIYGDTASVETTEAVSPMENYLVGVDFAFKAANVFSMDAEVVASEVTTDTRFPVIEAEWLPSWVSRYFKPRLSSHFDYAAQSKITVKVKDTEVQLNGKMVGPGFESFGASGLRNDILQYGTQIKTGFWKNRVSLNLGFQREQDNLIGTKGATTYLTDESFSLFLNFFPKWPSTSISFNRYKQTTKGLGTFQTIILGFTSVYNYMFKSSNMMSQIAVNYQRSDQPDTAYYNSQAFYTVMLTQMLSFRFPLTLTASVNYSHYDLLDQIDRQWSLDLRASYNFQSVFPELSLNYSTGDIMSQVGICGILRWTLPYDFTLSTELSAYKGKTSQSTDENGESKDYSEYKFYISLSKSW